MWRGTEHLIAWHEEYNLFGWWILKSIVISQRAYPCQFLFIGFHCPCPLSLLLAVWQPLKDNIYFIFLILSFSCYNFTMHEKTLVVWFFGWFVNVSYSVTEAMKQVSLVKEA
jgi:hypothetical protein